MNNTVNITTLLIAILLTASIIIIIMILLKNLKESRYNRDLRRAELESIRNSIEKKIYELNFRLNVNEDRWRDTNHLIIDSSKAIVDNSLEEIKLNKFLVNNGITKNDLVINEKDIFVLTPFNDIFIEDFISIQNLCNEVGFNCSRGDEEYFSSEIFKHILKQILKARIIIANISGRNPNVLYELGIAQTLGKSVILISKNPNEIPIDIKTKKFIIYKNEHELREKLRTEIIRILNT